MSKVCFGVDIGTNQLKIAVTSANRLQKMIVEPMPENIVRNERIVSPEAMTEFLCEVNKKYHLPTKKCRVVLPSSRVFTRQITMPYMNIEHLKLNLPYEFRDFITEDKAKYVYDYLVLQINKDDKDKPVSLELMASAILKSVICEYVEIFRRAKMKLEVAVSEEYAYRNIICNYQQTNVGAVDTEYCFIDLGHICTRIFIFKGDKLAATRVINYGGSILNDVIADACGVDKHIAETYKFSNYQNVLAHENCKAVYSHIALEISRAINFYNFNNPSSNLKNIYFCGGGSNIKMLTETIRQTVNMQVYNVLDLLDLVAQEDSQVFVSPIALGVTMQ